MDTLQPETLGCDQSLPCWIQRNISLVVSLRRETRGGNPVHLLSATPRHFNSAKTTRGRLQISFEISKTLFSIYELYERRYEFTA